MCIFQYGSLYQHVAISTQNVATTAEELNFIISLNLN